jgi:hypothetical protein
MVDTPLLKLSHDFDKNCNKYGGDVLRSDLQGEKGDEKEKRLMAAKNDSE